MEKVLALFSDALLLAAPIYEENKQLWTNGINIIKKYKRIMIN